MVEEFFSLLGLLEQILWRYIAISVILIVGAMFTLNSGFFQIKALFKCKKFIGDLLEDKSTIGTHPVSLYFASIGGMIGLGNIVVVTTVVTMGGPGSIIWMWIASLIGMAVKYSEIYCGLKYRKPHQHGYDGGPMYYLKYAFNNNIVPTIVCVLLCIYGVEVSQFLIITDTIVDEFGFDRKIVIGCLLFLVLISSGGGIKRLANVCSVLMPFFMVSYIGMASYVMMHYINEIPMVLELIWRSAWNGHAPVGGFAGSTMLMAAQYGVSRAVYSGDIGVGYDSIIQSDSQVKQPHKQARTGIYALFTDTFICSVSVMLILLTGVWKSNMMPSQYVVRALSLYIPYVEPFMVMLFFIAGFTTIISYLVVGQKCATFLNKKFGNQIYMIYVILAFIFFSFYDQEKVVLMMSVSGGLLVIFNLAGILKLRKEIKFQ